MRLRRLLALLLLVVLGLPSALPVFAAMQGDADASLPACCRTHGRHHCAMRIEASDSVASGTHGLRAAVEACPYRCVMMAQVHVDPVVPVAASLRIYAGLQSHPAVQAQTESRWRMARERARGKRGPPESGESADQRAS